MRFVGDFGVASDFEPRGEVGGGLVVLRGEVGLSEENLHFLGLLDAAADCFLVQLYSHFVAIAEKVLS